MHSDRRANHHGRVVGSSEETTVYVRRGLPPSLLREAVVHSNKAADKQRFTNHLRALFRNAAANEQELTTAANNAAVFLRAQRLHRELLERYNPTINLTSEEHLAATAHRVGLRLTDEE
ncbi:hypothetical protein EXIGLDRAFT_758272 [Exidia glandulosa HHB12029]|uniref:Uncharacterized protein n=1 Tax=Exidia glandulosa HHB12029 TaxID=1314781 RepID=A0A165QR14_EXIGL|nr:hypothetical protein EXIGLDRAFT_758272 [Exidia glandulosa HHB12029]